jgi:N-acetylglutamate synthase-like GNAT family acetyltransferase
MKDDIVIRRASPRDAKVMLSFVNRAARGKPKIDRVQLLQSFGEHGYMLAEVDGDLQAVVGWHTEDFIARIRQVVIYPARLRTTAGRALLEAVCESASELMCEVALLFPPADSSGRLLRFYRSCDFDAVSLEELIPAWRKAAQQSMPPESTVMVRKLREKRVMRPV